MIKKCSKGIHPDYVAGPEGETYRARTGRCPECHRAAQRRYGRSEKGMATHRRYVVTPKGKEAQKRHHERNRRRECRVGRLFLGMTGFTASEMEEMIASGKVVRSRRT